MWEADVAMESEREKEQQSTGACTFGETECSCMP